MNIVVIGAQWGDEGKGKIVDYLAEGAKYVCRFAGGANAGHTIVTEGKKYALHQIPSGILHDDKTVFLGSGMVIDPKALFDELDMLSKNGIDWQGRVFISDRAHIVLPDYIELDKKRDASRKHPIGTTGRGIGITYSQKSERDGIRLADLDWNEKTNCLSKESREFIYPYIEKLTRMKIDLAAEMYKIRNENILFEGAQGAMLDLDSGTYPFVSSGYSCSAGASLGGGIGPLAIDKIYGVFKAYQTRVGNGPMPTEFDSGTESSLCNYIRKTGNEFGVTTGRPRRCGYLDLVALRYACRVNSISSLVLTHLDVYDCIDEIEVCTAYKLENQVITDFPSSIPLLNSVKPVLKKFSGWKTSIKGIQDYSSLPENAKKYIEFIEEFTEVRISIISVGAERNQTFVKEDIWSK